MKLNVWMLCLAGCLAIAATVDAQQPGGGRGRGGGGFGGVFSLTQNEAVQKELALGSDKVDALKQISDDYGAAMREGMQGLQFFGPNATDADREKATKVRKEVTEKFMPKLKEALTADQFTRLQQINWQNQGTRAYSDEEVIKALAITKDQQDKIKAVGEEYQGKYRELFQAGAGGGGGGGNREKFQELAKEQEADTNKVLTKDQQDKFASMKGKPFDVEQLRPQFGRGGGGGGAPGGGGGGGGGGRPKRPQPKAE